MRYNLAVLNEQIDMYFSKKISSDELGQWAKTAYYDLLKGGYIEVDKLYSYPFIKEVTSLYSCSNEKEDSAFCKDKRLIEIQNVLKHQEDYIFSVTVRLPELPYKFLDDRISLNEEKRALFLNLQLENLQSMSRGSNLALSDLSEGEVKAVERIFLLNPNSVTLFDLVEEKILRMVKCIYETNEGVIERRNKLKLYSSDENLELKNLSQYIDYYSGKQSFTALVSIGNRQICDIL